MANPTGRLDLLLFRICERLAQQNPYHYALFEAFRPQIQKMLRPLDSPSLRRAVVSLAKSQGKLEPAKKKYKPSRKPLEVKGKVIEAQWVD